MARDDPSGTKRMPGGRGMASTTAWAWARVAPGARLALTVMARERSFRRIAWTVGRTVELTTSANGTRAPLRVRTW